MKMAYRIIETDTTRKCGLAGVGVDVALLEEVCYCEACEV